MDYFLLLLIVYTVLLLTSIIVFDLKILSPSIIFSASFTFMLSLAYATRESMGFTVCEKTFNVLATGGILFVATEMVVFLLININRRNKNLSTTMQPYSFKPLYIRDSTIKAFFYIECFSFALALVSIALSTSGSIGNRMEVYKTMMLNDVGQVKFRFILNQLFKINTATSYVSAYIVVYNCAACGERLKKQYKYIPLIALYFVYTALSQGARQPTIELIVFIFLMYFAWNLKHHDRRKIVKQIGKIILIAPFAAFAFTKTAEFVGRRTMKRQVLTYIATYFCGGLYAFNLHINEPARNSVWGQSSFANIYLTLNKFGIVPDNYVKAFHSLDLYGTTVTMFGRWYEDFGCIGVYTMTILVSLFFSILFYKYIYPRKRNQSLHLSKMIYGKLVLALVWAGYDDRIFALISFSNIFYLILIALVYKFFVEKHFRIKL